MVKNSPSNAGEVDLGLIPASGRSPGVENGNPLQYSCHGESHGQEEHGKQATVHGVKKSCTWLPARTHAHTHTHTHYSPWGQKELYMTTCTHARAHTHTHTAIQLRRVVHDYLRTHTHTHTHTQQYTWLPARTHTRTHTHTYIHTYIYDLGVDLLRIFLSFISGVTKSRTWLKN